MIQNAEQKESKSDEISTKEIVHKVREWVRYFLSKWVLIVILGIIGCGIGVTCAYLKKTIYKAELSFALQDEGSGGGLGGAIGLASQFGLDLGGGAGGEFSGDNLLELMKSRSMIEKTLLTTVTINNKKETLAEFYISFNNFRDSWKSNPALKNIYFKPNVNRASFTLQQDSLLGIFHKNIISENLTVEKVDKKLSIISVSVKSTNELFSKYFTETLAKVVSDFYIQTKTEKATNNVAILQKQVDSVRTALNTGIASVAMSADANPNPNPLLQTLHVPSQRKQIDVQTNSAILSELVKNLEMAKMSLLQETPLIQVIDRPILPLEKERLSKAKALIIGGFIGAFLAIVYLFLAKSLKGILN